MSLGRILATFAVRSIEELVANHAGRPVDCNPAHLSPEYADDLCILGDTLEKLGHPVTPNRARRQAALARVLKAHGAGC